LIEQKTVNSAWILYIRGIELQMEYERRMETEPSASNLAILEEIKENLQKLYTLVKDNDSRTD
jgi:hypothetical protein